MDYRVHGNIGLPGHVGSRSSTRASASSVWDSSLNVGESLALDLDDIGAVVTVDAVDTATHTLTVTVEFVEPSSQYHEVTLGVDVLDLGCDGGGAGAPAAASAATTVVRGSLASSPARAPSTSQSRAHPEGTLPVTMHVFGGIRRTSGDGSPPDVGAIASIDLDWGRSPLRDERSRRRGRGYLSREPGSCPHGLYRPQSPQLLRVV